MKTTYFTYPQEDYKCQCPMCDGKMYSNPVLVHQMDLTDGQMADFLAGLWGIMICEKCGLTDIWEY